MNEVHDALPHFSMPVVVKADGLAAGKGVVICKNKDEALTAASEMLSGKMVGEAGARVILEECLQGEELSFLLISDGEPTDEWQTAAAMVQQEEARKGLSFYSVAVRGAKLDTLARFSTQRTPLSSRSQTPVTAPDQYGAYCIRELAGGSEKRISDTALLFVGQSSHNPVTSSTGVVTVRLMSAFGGTRMARWLPAALVGLVLVAVAMGAPALLGR